MSKVRLYRPKKKTFRSEPKDGRVIREIQFTQGALRFGGELHEGTFAYVEPHVVSVVEYAKQRAKGGRAFDLWADRDRERLVAQVVTKSAVKRREAALEVLDADGSHLGLITREHPLKDGLSRARWTVEQPGVQPAVGLKGTLFWWYVWWLCSPLLVLAHIVSDGTFSPRAPHRTRWFAGGRQILEWRGSALHVAGDSWDPRVVSALVAVLTTYEGWVFDLPWDQDWLRHEGPG
jgi:hypothetical protein